MSDTAAPLAVIAKGRDGERLQIQVGRYKDAQFVDVRTYFRAADGGWHPTRKGVTVPPHRLDELIAALQRAKAELAQRAAK